MEHFKVERTTIGSIITEFPHSPEDRALSMEELLEDRLATGLELVAIGTNSDTELYLVFRVVGRSP